MRKSISAIAIIIGVSWISNGGDNKWLIESQNKMKILAHTAFLRGAITGCKIQIENESFRASTGDYKYHTQMEVAKEAQRQWDSANPDTVPTLETTTNK